MKKLLVTGGVLFTIMPALADSFDTTPLILPNSQNNSCSGSEYQGDYTAQTPKQMRAIYVTDSCAAGTYFDVADNAYIDTTTGIITNAGCETCPTEHYCPGIADISQTVVNGVVSTTGLENCPTGYTDGGTGVTSEANCAKTVNDSYCATHYPSSNFKHVATSGADAYTVVVNSESIDENDQIAFKDRDFEPVCLVSFGCEPGYIKQNAYQWMARHPEAISATHSWCSPNGTGTDCSTQERGTSVWTAVGSNRPIDNMHFVSVCTNREINDQNPSSLVISQTTAQFQNSDTGRYCWMRNVDLPDQPWFIARPYKNEDACAADCGHMHSSDDPTYMWGSMVNGEFVPADSRTVAVFSLLGSVTEGNTNADYCFANEITINWGIDENEQAITSTCTYGENNYYQAPSTIPAADQGYKFIGWKVSVSE